MRGEAGAAGGVRPRPAGRRGGRQARRPGGQARKLAGAAVFTWLCRAKIGGAADPATSPVSVWVVATSCLLLRHHAWRGTGVSPRYGNRRGQKC